MTWNGDGVTRGCDSKQLETKIVIESRSVVNLKPGCEWRLRVEVFLVVATQMK
ncbi:hypothetical protein HanRHA438_Chr00c35g0856091 [Helianthus annuus]|nr:hypothetical protein HanIR_Chr15g0752401 [Helianthus annuus]KAJ0953996.1 hypothetical protein HanRHA438_Chr00c35g0856091 [Helianthus annuus]